MHRILILPALLFFLASCEQSDPPAVAFYYWKTTFALTDKERQAVLENEVSTLYIRYFDVALIKGNPLPVRPIVFQEAPPKVTVVPVVYIRNEVMLSPTLDVKALANNVHDYIGQINQKHGIVISEVQFDCDWSLRSKDNYLAFITSFRKISKYKLSATIRLHQVKYYQTTGIPDVDYGVLMYYNMGHINADSSNSIYDRETAKGYLASLKSYPLRLDVAMPLFSWGIQSRNGKVVGLLNQWSTVDTTDFTSRDANIYEAKHNSIKRGAFFQKGDMVKIEGVAADDILEMANDISRHIPERPRQVIFYDLDEENLNRYENENELLKEVGSAF